MKITKDCYVDVSGWTEEEVEKAAKMFAKVGGGPVGNIDVGIPDDDYKYLMILGDGETFVGCSHDLYIHERGTKLTKQDIFEEHSSEWNGEGLPPVGTICEYQDFNGLWQGPARVFAHHESGGAFVEYIEYIGWDHSPNAERFRPIKSEKDKEIEKIDDVIDEWQDKYEMMAEKSLAEYLYENGFRFVEN